MPTKVDPQNLCLALMYADTEAEVIAILEKEGLWNDTANWRWLGDEKFNYSTVGNQQSRAEQAIIEKLTNAIDAKLLCEARLRGVLPIVGTSPQSAEAPISIADARSQFFGSKLNDLETLSRGITVAATGAKPRSGNGRPSFTIVDDGEGQTPSRMPETILSLNKGNKDQIKFVQGKFNMGGTGVLEFCGMDRNLQLVVSRRHPKLLPSPATAKNDGEWSFTIIRREDPVDGANSRYTYLAPVNAKSKPREGGLLSFAAKSMPIFPEKSKPYVREAEWGTLFKLFEYDARRFASQMMMTDGLMYRARLMLPEPALPIRFHECREYKGHSASFDTSLIGLVATLQADIDSAKRDNVEWNDVLEFSVDGEKFAARVYVFKSKDAADTYRRDEGIVFSLNGQCHGVLTKDFFRRKSVKQDYLWHSLLMVVDCSHISQRAKEKLIMNSRDRLKDTPFRQKVEAELEDQIGRHEALARIASERRKKEIAESPVAADSMAKVLEELLNKNPTLAELLGQGFRIKNPHKPESASAGVIGFIGRRFPTKFHIKDVDPAQTYVRDAHLEARVRVTFETDAANDYFSREDEPGTFELARIVGNDRVAASDWQRPRPDDGLATLSLSLPDDATAGQQLVFEARVNDPSRVEPLISTFALQVKPEKVTTPGTTGTKRKKGSEPGADKGGQQDGAGESQDSGLDIPRPTPVHEKDWKMHSPAFDKFTAVRVKRQPGGVGGPELFDYFINMDNVYLQTYLKARPKEAATMKLRFSVASTLVALSLLHQQQQSRKLGAPAEDFPDGKVDVADRIAQMTSAIAPFLLPMLETVGQLTKEEEHLSDSAGEAA